MRDKIKSLFESEQLILNQQKSSISYDVFKDIRNEILLEHIVRNIDATSTGFDAKVFNNTNY